MYLFVLSVDARDKICPKNVKDGVEKSVKSWGLFLLCIFHTLVQIMNNNLPLGENILKINA